MQQKVAKNKFEMQAGQIGMYFSQITLMISNHFNNAYEAGSN